MLIIIPILIANNLFLFFIIYLSLFIDKFILYRLKQNLARSNKCLIAYVILRNNYSILESAFA